MLLWWKRAEITELNSDKVNRNFFFFFLPSYEKTVLSSLAFGIIGQT